MGQSLTKADLVDRVAQGAGTSKADTERVLNSLFDALKRVAAEGEKVTFPSVGTFEGRLRPAGEATNPQNPTGPKIKTQARMTLKFKESSALKASLLGK